MKYSNENVIFKMLWSKFHREIDKVLVFWVSDELEIDHFWVMINARVIHGMTFW